jgi:Methylamine utilisation protein MauE
MTAAIAPLFATAAAVVVLAGASKLHSRDGARAALGAVGLPAGELTVLSIGAGEVVLGLVCLASPGLAGAACLAAAYLAFALVIALLLRQDEAVPCGCFGAASFSASKLHLALDLVAAGVCMAAAATGVTGLLTLANGASGLVLVLGVAGATYLSFLAFALVPELWRSYGSAGEAS